jgi:hypothetical protein
MHSFTNPTQKNIRKTNLKEENLMFKSKKKINSRSFSQTKFPISFLYIFLGLVFANFVRDWDWDNDRLSQYTKHAVSTDLPKLSFIILTFKGNTHIAGDARVRNSSNHDNLFDAIGLCGEATSRTSSCSQYVSHWCNKVSYSFLFHLII